MTPPNRELAPFTPPSPATPPAVPVVTPARQLSDLPADELSALAEELGLDVPRAADAAAVVAAIHARRQLIASIDREALFEVVRWGRRPVTANATKEQVAREIARVTSMRFNGLSDRGLVALAKLRGLAVADTDLVPAVVKKLRKKESVFARLGRRRRAVLGSLIARIVGEDAGARQEYHYLPPSSAAPSSAPVPPRSPASLKEEIEDVGLLGGLTNRVKRSADSYLNQKLDEIESRIDRKLDEIDRRLGEWRDKEIANRIRILKITLYASVIVGIVSLIYAYLKVYVPALFGG